MNFDQSPYTVVQGLCQATLKIQKKSNLDQNQLKLLHNISTCICIKKCNENGEFSHSHF